MERKTTDTKIIAESALLVAIACVLSLFPKFKFLAQGGSITVCSMLPIILVSYRRGLKWGFLAAFAFAVFQTLTGLSAAGMGFWSVAGMIFFDYFAAFTVLGIGGIFRGKLKTVRRELVCGSLAAIALRYMCNTISGFIFFREWAEWFFEEMGEFGASILARFSGNGLYLLYSLVYNGSYLIPEMLLTCIVAALFSGYALRGAE